MGIFQDLKSGAIEANYQLMAVSTLDTEKYLACSDYMSLTLVTQYSRSALFMTDFPIKRSSFWETEGGCHRLKADPETVICPQEHSQEQHL